VLGLIRQGRLTETRELAFGWADLTEPKMSAASRDQMAAWGRLLMRACAAAARRGQTTSSGMATRHSRLALAPGSLGSHGKESSCRSDASSHRPYC
jgi:hypothetical protein